MRGGVGSSARSSFSVASEMGSPDRRVQRFSYTGGGSGRRGSIWGGAPRVSQLNANAMRAAAAASEQQQQRQKPSAALRNALILHRSKASKAGWGAGGGTAEPGGGGGGGAAAAKLAVTRAEHSRASRALHSANANFERLSEAERDTMIRQAKRLQLPRYTPAYREGAVAHHFFVLLQGRMQVTTSAGADTDGVELMSVEGGAEDGVFFGPEALHGTRRARTVTAMGPCVVLQFAADELGLGSTDSGVALLRACYGSFVRAELGSMPIFKGLDEDVMGKLAPLFELQVGGGHPECEAEGAARWAEDGGHFCRIWALRASRSSTRATAGPSSTFCCRAASQSSRRAQSRRRSRRRSSPTSTQRTRAHHRPRATRSSARWHCSMASRAWRVGGRSGGMRRSGVRLGEVF